MTSPSSQQLKAGSEILYHCPRCSLELWHKVLAMIGNQPARIRCNTCGSERNYKAKRKTSEFLKKNPSAKKTSLDHSSFYRERLKAVGAKPSKPYRMDIELNVEDLVEHKKFGLGVVLKIIPPDRAEIAFPEELKTLACKV